MFQRHFLLDNSGLRAAGLFKSFIFYSQRCHFLLICRFQLKNVKSWERERTKNQLNDTKSSKIREDSSHKRRQVSKKIIEKHHRNQKYQEQCEKSTKFGIFIPEPEFWDLQTCSMRSSICLCCLGFGWKIIECSWASCIFDNRKLFWWFFHQSFSFCSAQHKRPYLVYFQPTLEILIFAKPTIFINKKERQKAVS